MFSYPINTRDGGLRISFHKLYCDIKQTLLLYKADIVIITDIYAAREEPIKGVSSQIIIDDLINLGHNKTQYISNKENISSYLKKIAKNNDIIITMGAGNIWREIENIYDTLK